MVRDPLLASLRAWLVFLSLFELPEIHGFLLGDKSLADGFGSGLQLWLRVEIPVSFVQCRVGKCNG